MEPRNRPALILALCAALLLPVSACGPTAEQLEARKASPGTSADHLPSGPARPAPRPVPPAPAETSPPPAPVAVTGSQAGMPQAVQDACQVLLRRAAGPLAGTDTGNCVAAAVTAGGGAVQSLQVATSWLPPGQYTVRFETEPGFAMTLQGEPAGNSGALGIRSSPGRRVLQGDQGDITADPGGSAEEAYAAVLADAAELTVRPDRVGGLLGAAGQVSVEYGAVMAGTAYTRLSADFRAAPASGTDPPPLTVIPEGSLTMYLDDYYRPVRIEISGLNQGIPSQITAVNTGWGSRPLS